MPCFCRAAASPTPDSSNSCGDWKAPELNAKRYRTDEYGIEPVADGAAALDAVGRVGARDAVLVKGSRVAGLEQVAAALLGAGRAGSGGVGPGGVRPGGVGQVPA